jgi:hypothetical protein
MLTTLSLPTQLDADAASCNELPVDIEDYWFQALRPSSGVLHLTEAIKINRKLDATFQGQDRTSYSGCNNNTYTADHKGKLLSGAQTGACGDQGNAACYFLSVVYQLSALKRQKTEFMKGITLNV